MKDGDQVGVKDGFFWRKGRGRDRKEQERKAFWVAQTAHAQTFRKSKR